MSVKSQTGDFDARIWADELRERLCKSLDARVTNLRTFRYSRNESPCGYTARRAAEGILEWSLIASLIGDLDDPRTLLRLFGQRDEIEAYVRSIAE
jgi:hypothetical protein